MGWAQLTYDDMRLYLAKDELDKLQNASIDEDLSSVVNDTLDLVSDAFRGAFIAKGYQVDNREHYTPSSYKPFIMAYARWTLWNRFPMAQNYALSDARKDEWKIAADLLKNPYIGTDPVSPEGGGEDPGDDPVSHLSADAAITIPWLRIEPECGKYGFPEAYWVEKKPIL